MSAPSVAFPGQILGPANSNTLEQGTHIYNSSISASILGSVSTSQKNTPQVLRTSSSTTLPGVDSTVLALVTRITPRQATVDIQVMSPSSPDGLEIVCATPFQGVIRAQDVRATEKDTVKIFASFRPGDIVRATVISLGDQSNYYLSTAQNHLGVVIAASELGNQMYPISWREFKDPTTGQTENRKVAKPF